MSDFDGLSFDVARFIGWVCIFAPAFYLAFGFYFQWGAK